MQPHQLKLITAPTVEPVTLAEAKLHLRVDHSTDDAMIGVQITAAREWVENFLNRALCTQVWELYLDEFPPGLEGRPGVKDWRQLYAIWLPLGRIQSVDFVKYVDPADGSTLLTISAANYHADLVSDYSPRIVPKSGYSWPTPNDQPSAVVVRFTAGYGAAADIPAKIKQAILILVGSLYEHRESEITGTIATELDHGLKMLLWPTRLVPVA